MKNKIKQSEEDLGLLFLMQQANKNKVVSRKEIMKVLSDNKK
ncbi:hypothetical protein ACPDHJ_00080 [Myroides sp. C8-3]